MARFDWDEANRDHLKRHRVSPVEFEQAMSNDPLDLAWEDVEGEVRYHAVGMTAAGRLLYMIWAVRAGAVRAVTAFSASHAAKQAWHGRRR